MLLLFRLQSKGEGVPKRSTAKKKNEKKRKNRPHGVCGRGNTSRQILSRDYLLYFFQQLVIQYPVYDFRFNVLGKLAIMHVP